MPRRERPLDAGDSLLLAFARGLRELRATAGGPTYRELSARAHYSEAALSQAAAGRKLPSLAVTLAYVRACGGSEEEWERRWRETAAAEEPRVAEDIAGSPYVGLAAFQPEDAERFFGRDRLVEQLVARVARQRVVVVVGASGAGKSSVLRAGLVPRLAGRAVLFTPGAHPVEEYVVQLARHLDTPLRHTDDARAWRLAVRTAAGDTEPVLVVDQFEEVFTLCQDAGERRRFVDGLTDAAAHGGYRVVLGVRADFYGHCARYPDLVEAMDDGLVTVGPMTTEEVRAAIVQPAARTGHAVETALVAELVAHSVEQAGALPLLSHALRETWHRRRGNTLTLRGFQAVGGFEGALARTAESVYEGLSQRQRELARSLFTRLTALGESTEDTKRRIARTELDDDEDTTHVLAALSEHRLVTLDRDRVEIGHEALIRGWPRLRGWLAADRDGLRAHRQLAESAAVWDSLDRDASALYRGARLEPVRDWLDRPRHPLTARERDFLTASLAAETAERTAVRRRGRRLRQLVALLTALLVFSVVVTVRAVHSDAAATRERNHAISQKVAREAEEVRAADPATAAQLALAAYRLTPTTEARTALLESFTPGYATEAVRHGDNVNEVAYHAASGLLATASRDRTTALVDITDPHHPRTRRILRGHTDNVTGVAFTSDGSVVATASWDRTVRLWETATGRPLAVLTGHTDAVNAVAFSPDDRLLATGGTDDTARLWDVRDRRHPRPLSAPAVHAEAVVALAFSPDGLTLVTGSWDGVVHRWDVTDPAAPRDRPLTGHHGAVHAVAISPDGQAIATGSDDRTVRLWSADGGSVVLAGHTDAVRAVDFSPDGRRVVSTSADRSVRLWDRDDLGEPVRLTGHTASVVAAEYAGGHTLATAGDDHTVRLWDLPGAVLLAHRDSVYGVAVAPSGRLAATASYDRTVRLWDLSTGTVLAVLHGPGDAVNSLAFTGDTLVGVSADHLVHRWDVADPRGPRPLRPLAGHADAVNAVAAAGGLVATGGTDRVVRLWYAATGEPAGVLAGHTDSVESLAFSPDGRWLASASADFTVRLWRVGAREPARVLTGHSHAVKSVAFSPDGRVLVTGSADHTARLWSAATGARLGVLSGHTDTVHAVAFSPSGDQVATASADRSVRLWRVTDRAELATLTGHTDRVYALTYTEDGHTLLSAGGDHTTRRWEADDEHAAARVCATAHPPLDEETWREHFEGVAFTPVC